MMMIMYLQIKLLLNLVGQRECVPHQSGTVTRFWMLLDHDEPTNYEEAMMSPNSTKWLEAMKSKMGSMYEQSMDFDGFAR